MPGAKKKAMKRMRGGGKVVAKRMMGRGAMKAPMKRMRGGGAMKKPVMAKKGKAVKK